MTAQVWSASAARHHVQFYEDASVLAEQVAAFLGAALRSGGRAIAVARPLTLAVIELQLAKAGYDMAALQHDERLALIDATELLPKLMVGDMPDRARFQQHLGTLVQRFAHGGCPVNAYGELVDIMWCAGNRAAVAALEALWSEVLLAEQVRLVCGYQLRSFDRDIEGFERVCDQHDAIGPTQSPALPLIRTSRVLAQLEQRARALESEVARRTHLERRMAQLLDIGGALAAASDLDQIASITVRHGAAALGAVDGALWLLTPDGAQLQMLDSSRVLFTKVDASQYQLMPVDGDTPGAYVARTKEPVFLRTMAEYGALFPASRARLEKLLPSQQCALAVLPIALDDRLFGVIVFTFDREREFTTADRAFKAILARQCAFALRRIEQHEAERALREAAERAAAAEKDARAEIELLYDLITTLNQLDDPAAVYDLALDTVRRGTRSDRAAILLFDADGVMRFQAAHGLSMTYQRAVDGHTPWQRDAIAPAPLVVHDTETDPAWASYRDVFRAEGIRALAFVPVLHHRTLIGKFMLYRNEPRAFEVRELQFASTLAVHVAHAVERWRADVELARAYREERAAHLEAEEATRAREEILSVVSHDLRNPLGTILMGATSLLGVDAGERTSRVRTIAERIHRQAERMARQIEDLVDFAGIEAGQLAIQREARKPEEILSAASDIFSVLAHERGLTFETRTLPNLPPVDCDPERAVQVFSNLVGNALKVTPKGGAIAIGAEPRDDEVVFFVRDTGPGIAADELPQLFERYWRSKQSQYKGAGLGLSIARGIVTAHGGRIWVESQPGRGTTFYFSLVGRPSN